MERRFLGPIRGSGQLQITPYSRVGGQAPSVAGGISRKWIQATHPHHLTASRPVGSRLRLWLHATFKVVGRREYNNVICNCPEPKEESPSGIKILTPKRTKNPTGDGLRAIISFDGTLILKIDGVQDQGITERNRLKVFIHQDFQYLYKGNKRIHPIKTLERREGLESRLVEETFP
ncbi:hypothetical protein [Gorillibacterium sp. sgz5001074]|uniref:hypothetical protein n=1 Tax=Gorillibacterium sp. sgz5001074 TaxID=3446695 RepID=UPI003F66B83D